LTSLLGVIPFWGMSTTRPLTIDGEQRRSVVVAILSGNDLKLTHFWQPQFGRDSSGAGRDLAQMLARDEARQGLLLATDGIQGDTSQILPSLTGINLPVAGGLAAGEVQMGKTYQFGGSQWANGALSGLGLGGRLRLGTGFGQGWQDTSIHFTISKARNVWLQSLDGQTAAEAYARIFGTSAREWAFPPLTQLARLYPLGLEVSPGRPERIVRSPLQVEVDGSFRMNTSIGEGQIAHLMVGDPQNCLDAARHALREALSNLQGARPMLAIVLVDYAWQMLFETRTGQLGGVLREELNGIPLVGGYTLGQITRPAGEGLARLHNQAFLAAVIGEARP
jgi:hypothetical protein